MKKLTAAKWRAPVLLMLALLSCRDYDDILDDLESSGRIVGDSLYENADLGISVPIPRGRNIIDAQVFLDSVNASEYKFDENAPPHGQARLLIADSPLPGNAFVLKAAPEVLLRGQTLSFQLNRLLRSTDSIIRSRGAWSKSSFDSIQFQEVRVFKGSIEYGKGDIRLGWIDVSFMKHRGCLVTATALSNNVRERAVNDEMLMNMRFD